MAVCPRCGAAVAQSDLSCGYCGLPRPVGAPAGSAPYSPPRRQRTATVVIVTLLVVLVLAIASLAVLWATGTPPFGPKATGTAAAGPDTTSASSQSPTSAPVSTSAPTTEPASTSDPTTGAGGDFSQVYSQVESGVGLVSVDTCDAAYTGTGFLVARDTVVTSAHVVAGATDVSVAFDGRQVDATVAGVDPAQDLAVLSIPATSRSRHVFELATRDPATGTPIAVIGYPLDEPKSLTTGTISGSGRTISTESGTFEGLLQTDAAINPGNSGGPLLNSAGQIVGVADAIRRHAQGIGFAVPISQVRGPIDSGSGLSAPPAPPCLSPPPSSSSSATEDIKQTLTSYLDAINIGDYTTAMSLVSGSIRADSSQVQWLSDYSTTYDDQLSVQAVASSGSAATVWATFRSRQEPGYGPAGAESATCLLWSLDYSMIQQDGGWIIDSVKGHGDPAWTRCD